MDPTLIQEARQVERLVQWFLTEEATRRWREDAGPEGTALRASLISSAQDAVMTDLELRGADGALLMSFAGRW